MLCIIEVISSKTLEDMDRTDEVMKNIFGNTDTISDNINQLSATSEEIVASANEGLIIFQNAVKTMKEVRKTLDFFNQIAENLKFYARVEA